MRLINTYVNINLNDEWIGLLKFSVAIFYRDVGVIESRSGNGDPSNCFRIPTDTRRLGLMDRF